MGGYGEGVWVRSKRGVGSREYGVGGGVGSRGYRVGRRGMGWV